MANKYYYICSQMPYLEIDRDHYVGVDRFLEECRKWMSSRDMDRLGRAEIRYAGDYPVNERGFLKKWALFSSRLDRDVIAAREAVRSGESKVPEGVKGIFGKSNPLEVERAYEQAKWDFLSEEEKDYDFDLNWLIIYFIKLQILKRLESFDKDRGEDLYKKACEVKDEDQ